MTFITYFVDAGMAHFIKGYGILTPHPISHLSSLPDPPVGRAYGWAAPV
jgi:hypothetical protein